MTMHPAEDGRYECPLRPLERHPNGPVGGRPARPIYRRDVGEQVILITTMSGVNMTMQGAAGGTKSSTSTLDIVLTARQLVAAVGSQPVAQGLPNAGWGQNRPLGVRGPGGQDCPQAHEWPPRGPNAC